MYTPHSEKGDTSKMCAMLDKIQLEAARIIAGAFRGTSAVTLDIELFILPMRQRLEKSDALYHMMDASIQNGPDHQNLPCGRP